MHNNTSLQDDSKQICDNDTVFVLYKNVASEYSVIAINGSNSTYLTQQAFQANGLDNYSDADYFELNGTRYIVFVYDDGAYNFLSLFDIDAKQYYGTSTYSLSGTYTDILQTWYVFFYLLWFALANQILPLPT